MASRTLVNMNSLRNVQSMSDRIYVPTVRNKEMIHTSKAIKVCRPPGAPLRHMGE